MNTCQFVFPIQIISAGFALAAAVLWLKASRIEMPPPRPLESISMIEGRKDLNEAVAAAAIQGKQNASAAICAAIAAVLQAVLSFFPTCFL